MIKPLIDEKMKSRIDETFEITECDSNPGKLRAYNKKLQMTMIWAFDSPDAARAFIASVLLEEDRIEDSKKDKIDPRINIMEDFEGDVVLHIEGPATFGTFGCESDALPLASQLSKVIINENYYADPSDPTVK